MIDKNIYEKTRSIWDWFNEHWEKFQNPFYQKNNSGVLQIDPSIKALKLWTEHFFRLTKKEITVSPNDLICQIFEEIQIKNLALVNHIKELEKKLQDKNTVINHIRDSINQRKER